MTLVVAARAEDADGNQLVLAEATPCGRVKGATEIRALWKSA